MVQNYDGFDANRIMFQQNGAPHHTLHVRQYLDLTFSSRWIRGDYRVVPARLPDLPPLDFFLWGQLESKIYFSQKESLERLRRRISNECQQITTKTLQCSVKFNKKTL